MVGFCVCQDKGQNKTKHSDDGKIERLKHQSMSDANLRRLDEIVQVGELECRAESTHDRVGIQNPKSETRNRNQKSTTRRAKQRAVSYFDRIGPALGPK